MNITATLNGINVVIVDMIPSDHTTLIKDSAAGWTNLGRDGTFTDGGAG